VILAVMPDALVGVFYDDGLYLGLARSLVEGHGYRHLHLPGAPAGVHYPWLYPLWLAGLWRLWPAFPDNVVLLRGANAVLMGGFTALSVLYLGRRLALRPVVLALLLAAAATAIPVVAVATVLFSEPLFLVLAAGACWAADAAGDGASGRRRDAAALLAGVLAALAALTRSIGIAVVAGVVVPLLLARRWRAAVAAAVPPALALGAWAAWVATHRAGIDPAIAANYGTYGDFVGQGGVQGVSVQALGELLQPLGAITLGMLPAPARAMIGLPVLVVTAAGLGVMLRRAPAAGWSSIAYAAIVVAWPYGPSRFLWAAVPWLVVALAAGVQAALRRLATLQPPRQRVLRALLGAALAAPAMGFAFYQVSGFARGHATATQVGISATMELIVPWVRDATPADAVIASEDEALIWLYTGRRAVPNYLWQVRGRDLEEPGPDSLAAWLRRAGATHLVLSGPGSDAAPTVDALLARDPGLLSLVRVWPEGPLAFAVRGTASAAAAR
jgi:hypothetical protein